MDAELPGRQSPCVVTHLTITPTEGPPPFLVNWHNPPDPCQTLGMPAPGTFTVTAYAVGYSTDTVVLQFVEGITTTQDFYLWRPMIEITPTQFISVSVPVSEELRTSLVIRNPGHRPVDYEIVEGTVSNPGDLPWVWTSPDSGTIASGGSVQVDVTFSCQEPGDQSGTLSITHSDPCRDPIVIPMRIHCGGQETADLAISKGVIVPGYGPVKPGGTVQYAVQVSNAGPDAATNVVFTDTLPTGLSYQSSTGDCTLLERGPPHDVLRCSSGDRSVLPPLWTWGVLVTARADEHACGPLVNRAETSSDTPDPDLSNNSASGTVDAGPCPERPLIFAKSLVDPVSGVAAVGDVVRFDIRVTNPGMSAVTVRLEDGFLNGEFEYVSASLTPTSHCSSSTNDALAWTGVTIPAGGTVNLQLRLRTKVPGIVAKNCATYITYTPQGTIDTIGPKSCATVRVQGIQGRHSSVYKKFITPSNHVAQLGDWFYFETKWTNTGTVAANQVSVSDDLVPASVVAGGFPLHVTWAGGSLSVGASFKTQDTASPAVNTAEWTATWPDGSKTTQTVSDYIYIVDGPIAKDLFLSKTLMDPQPSAVVSDTVTFRVAITNASGADMATLALSDQFDQQCLTFQSASLPPDHVGAGTVSWNNVGPLAAGGSRTIDVLFHADAVCPMAFNCADVTHAPPGGQTVHAAGCDKVPILGGRPQLVVRKIRTSPSPTVVGDTVVWEIEVENTGSAAISAVPLHDGYQVAHFDFLSGTPAPSATDLIHGRLDWNNLGSLAPGGKRTVTLRLRAKAPGLGATNCAESNYTVGSSNFTPSDCATVDILSEPPFIRVQKERVAQNPNAPVAVGDNVTYKLSVSNVGPVPLSNVYVLDEYNVLCMAFVSAPGMATSFTPGLLSWDIGALAVGETRSWEVVFEVTDICSAPPFGNCVIADGVGPQGQPVHDATCLEIEAEPARPDLRVVKRLAEPLAQPVLGSVLRYEIVVQNPGNTTLAHVEAHDDWDSDCLEYVGAIPAPDGVDAASGIAFWANVGPLGPGESAVISVFLRAKAICAWTPNCVQAIWLVDDIPELDAMDCVEVTIGQTPTSTPTATPTVTPTGRTTPTPTSTRHPQVTATPTRPAGEAYQIYLPLILEDYP